MKLTMAICGPVLAMLGARKVRARHWTIPLGDSDSIIKLTKRGWVFDGRVVETVADMLEAAFQTGRHEGRAEAVADVCDFSG
jgi:hypothetical protein